MIRLVVAVIVTATAAAGSVLVPSGEIPSQAPVFTQNWNVLSALGGGWVKVETPRSDGTRKCEVICVRERGCEPKEPPVDACPWEGYA